MYNRYVPQSDGSFIRSRVPEPPPQNQSNIPLEKIETEAQTETRKPEQRNTQGKPKQRNFQPASQNYRSPKHHSNQETIGGFFKNLLPENLDAEDLIVILLLLLMSGSGANGSNNALLTLLIYLYM